MPKFSARSQLHLATCHPELQRLFNEAIKRRDCTVLCGHRTKEDQNEAFLKGNSKLSWPRSKHNKMPSLAVDVMPYPLKWDDVKGHDEFADFIKHLAIELGIKVRWGGDFKGFRDVPHWELTEIGVV